MTNKYSIWENIMNLNKELWPWQIVFAVLIFMFFLPIIFPPNIVKNQTQDTVQIAPPTQTQETTELGIKEIVKIQPDRTQNQENLAKQPDGQASLVPQNTLFCNGKYWTKCPTGQIFSCPAKGDAQCLIPQPTPQSSQNDAQYLKFVDLINQRADYCETLSEQFEILSKVENNIAITSEEFNKLTSEQQQAVNSKHVYLEYLKAGDAATGCTIVPSGNEINCTSNIDSFGTKIYTKCN
jgi:hypothetical protein